MLGEIEVPNEHTLLNSGGVYQISALLQSQMCYVGQQHVFTDASETFYKLLGIEVNAKQIERVCHHYGEKLEEDIQKSIRTEMNEEHYTDDKSYYVMLDGGMVLTREEKWKEMKLGRIFEENQNITISKGRGFIGSSTYIAHLGGHKDFLAKVEAHVDKMGNAIFIADGAKWIWKWVEAMYPESTQVLDFFHAKEHLCQWAGLAFKEEKQKQNWIHEQCMWLMNNKIERVIENISHIKIYTKKARQCKRSLIEYYTENKERMRYKTYREKGLLIGSGPIEAAHRHVIQQRMKLSGQRWTKKGVQQIANLRVANKSNQWHKVVELTSLAA